jgi:hypothetical protein
MRGRRHATTLVDMTTVNEGYLSQDWGVDLLSSLPTFLVAVVLISASPGPAMALILRRAALQGFRGAVPTVLGLEAGLYMWALLAAAGVAALVAASEVAFIVLRVIGAAVLIILGVKAWLAVWRSRGSDELPVAELISRQPRHSRVVDDTAVEDQDQPSVRAREGSAGT